MHEKTKKYESKRIVTTILKMDENNHYGNAMIKPLLIDVKKKNKKLVPTWENLTCWLSPCHMKIKSAIFSLLT